MNAWSSNRALCRLCLVNPGAIANLARLRECPPGKLADTAGEAVPMQAIALVPGLHKQNQVRRTDRRT
jgi:hypothetical protein